MKSIQFSEYGVPDSLRLVEAEPTPARAGEVRVAIEAAPLNPSDFMLTDGRYPFRPALPSPAGSEGVGRVIDVGDGVTAVEQGDRVLVLPSGQPGTWQQEIVIAERFVVRVGRDIDPVQLATVGINAATAHLLLRYGNLRPGAWVAQTAANSGLGAFIIALARRAGLRTLNIVRRPGVADPLLDAGADAVVVSDDALTAGVGEALGDEKVSLLLDGVGGPLVAELAPFLAREADIVSFAAMSGQPIAVHPMYLNFKNLHVHGFWLNNWLDSAPRAEIEQVYAEIIDLIADRVLSTRIEATYRLDEHAEAIAHARSTGRHGKIVFTNDVLVTR
ncbi:zinc-dependent alcohol dehydrogenase family protein [Micromonospora sp. WMMD1155]|uniref:zinc-dependent alcohol dehydrogenase family protein n=1 Tax=Micromonospora sp. WMMD1155 TaxID=3016094 RepID=UPI00249C335B|nr:zinc-dependent alcohol dehydrogenase family protein [Micromonospora sp. WMMD1155]WFE48798.1 zinc-dependent alcohol dehydrogenase family protein [Micromonospora sp. WMMD1155]WFE54950.1 zinc-dependent alcohol dehydrogenase family protein [Micromonospora sp. WMMD1155]